MVKSYVLKVFTIWGYNYLYNEIIIGNPVTVWEQETASFAAVKRQAT